jgi:hypothetical protein
VAAVASEYKDVKQDAWYADTVAYVVRNGFMTGKSSGSFVPKANLTRAEMAKILHNVADNPTTTEEHDFSDIPANAWYADAISWASSAGVVTGYEDGTFAPSTEVTREQLVAMLYRYAKYIGQDVTASASLDAFKDSASVAGYAKAPMQWAVANGFIKGNDANALNPKGNATRVEAAAIIARFVEAAQTAAADNAAK